MKLGINAENKIAGIGPIWLLPAFLTKVQIVVNRLMESSLEFIDTPTLKGDDIPKIGNLPVKGLCFIVEGDGAVVSL